MPLTEVEKYYVKKNFMGLMKMPGLTPETAMEMALEHEGPLFSARLKGKSPGSTVIGQGGGGGNTTYGGGTEGAGSKG